MPEACKVDSIMPEACIKMFLCLRRFSRWIPVLHACVKCTRLAEDDVRGYFVSSGAR